MFVVDKFIDLTKKGIFFLRNPPIYVNDPFVNIINASVSGWLDKGHLYCFDYAMKHIDSKSPIVEIGAYCGLSTCVIAHYKRKHNRSNKLFTIDTWSFEDSKNVEYAKKAKYEIENLFPFIIDSFKNNVNFFSKDNLPIAVHSTSDDFFEKVAKHEPIDNLFFEPYTEKIESISFAYIDGNHTYPFAKRDFENVDKLLEVGGFVLFDDSADFVSWGSNKVAREVNKLPNYKLIKKNPCYFFQKIK